MKFDENTVLMMDNVGNNITIAQALSEIDSFLS